MGGLLRRRGKDLRCPLGAMDAVNAPEKEGWTAYSMCQCTRIAEYLAGSLATR